MEASADDIIVANSPTKRILSKDEKGIQSYRCLHADVNGNIRVKELSCQCRSCASSNYQNCDEEVHAGIWVDCNMKEHPLYKDVQPKRKRRRISDDSNHNNR